ncbi:MAG TPA: Asp-tRNA(Asn)/Glu-tRNA(Gln) amidotransferase subunit GatC [bacterium]|nr:Asp-tRNA(Asn)/Glu-tRNA(Gln) amidotransferase subunit GatC [bacterium]
MCTDRENIKEKRGEMITKKEVEYVARLARLKLTEDEKEKYTKQLADILKYINKLNELDTEKVEPTSHVLRLSNVFREDKVRPSLKQEEILANAPEVESSHFKVKKIIE